MGFTVNLVTDPYLTSACGVIPDMWRSATWPQKQSFLFRGDNNERTSIQEVTLRHFDDLQQRTIIEHR
jgi:hypothetical protein